MPADADEVHVVIAGSELRGWYSVDIDSDIFSEADSFEVAAKLPERRYLGLVREGVRADVYVGADRQMAAKVDKSTISIARGKSSLQLSGRDLGAELLDNETETVRATKYTLKTLVEKLLRPSFGIRSVIISNEDNRKRLLGKKDRASSAGKGSKPFFSDAPRSVNKIDPGKKIAAVINENCARAGVTWWMTAGGDLYLGKPNYVQEVAFAFYCYAAGSAKAGTHNNVEQVTIARELGDRASELIVLAQGQPKTGLFATKSGAGGARFKAVAHDPDLLARGIDRKRIVSDNDCVNSQMTRQRAATEMGKRQLAGLTINVTVPGFRQDGRLYTVDTLASVVIEDAGVEGIYYVAQRRFLEERGKRRTTLTLREKGLYLP